MSAEVATPVPVAIARAPVLTVQLIQMGEGVYHVHDVSTVEVPFHPEEVIMPAMNGDTTVMAATTTEAVDKVNGEPAIGGFPKLPPHGLPHGPAPHGPPHGPPPHGPPHFGPGPVKPNPNKHSISANIEGIFTVTGTLDTSTRTISLSLSILGIKIPGSLNGSFDKGITLSINILFIKGSVGVKVQGKEVNFTYDVQVHGKEHKGSKSIFHLP